MIPRSKVAELVVARRVTSSTACRMNMTVDQPDHVCTPYLVRVSSESLRSQLGKTGCMLHNLRSVFALAIAPSKPTSPKTGQAGLGKDTRNVQFTQQLKVLAPFPCLVTIDTLPRVGPLLHLPNTARSRGPASSC